MTLRQLRTGIDRIDVKLVRLLNRRSALAQDIGRAKKVRGARVRDHAREQAVLRRVAALNRGPMSRGALLSIYRTIIAACRGVQE